MDLTVRQEKVVRLLWRHSRWDSTRVITQDLNIREDYRSGVFTIGQVRSILARLENREIVVRRGFPARWQLTTHARNHLLAKGFKSDSKTT